MVPSNHSNFQYCESNIGLSSIASCKVINFNPLCNLFGISYRKVGRAITKWGAIEKSSILLTQYWNNYNF